MATWCYHHSAWFQNCVKWKVENSSFEADILCCIVRHNITAAVTETLSNCGSRGHTQTRAGVVLLFSNWPFTWGAWAMSSPPNCPIALRSKEHSRQNSQKLGGQISLFYLFLTKFKCSQKLLAKIHVLHNGLCTIQQQRPILFFVLCWMLQGSWKIALLWRLKLESKIRVNGQLLKGFVQSMWIFWGTKQRCSIVIYQSSTHSNSCNLKASAIYPKPRASGGEMGSGVKLKVHLPTVAAQKSKVKNRKYCKNFQGIKEAQEQCIEYSISIVDLPVTYNSISIFLKETLSQEQQLWKIYI